MAEQCPVIKDEVKEVDIYRDTPVRLLGYANEVGEAFRALVNVKFVYASYGLASAYVLADTNDKASKAKKLLGILISFFNLFCTLDTFVSYYTL